MNAKDQFQLVKDKCPIVWEFLINNGCPSDFNFKDVEVYDSCPLPENSEICLSCWNESLRAGELDE